MNELLKLMYEKLGRGKELSPEVISWNIAPSVNAVTRSGNIEDMKIFFDALVGNIPPEQGLKVARKAHRVQTEVVKEMFEDAKSVVDTEHSVCFGVIKDCNPAYVGLCANKLMSEYNKPTILLRENSTTTYSGSLRSPIPLANIINESGFAHAQGHLEAAGCWLQRSKLKRLVAYLDAQLDLSVTPDIDVTANIEPNDITLSLCEVIDKNKILWGHGLECPQFYLKAHIAPSQVQVFTKRSTTIRITIDGIAFILFFAKDTDVEALSNVNGEVEFIVKVGVNEYMGDVSPQGIIEKYEICEEDESDEDYLKYF